MDGAIDGKEGYEKTDHGLFFNMVYFVFPLGKCLILGENLLYVETGLLLLGVYLANLPGLKLQPEELGTCGSRVPSREGYQFLR
jgi:hypothetical protein